MKKSKEIILLMFFMSFVFIGCVNNNNMDMPVNKTINEIKEPAQNLHYIDHGHGKRGIDY